MTWKFPAANKLAVLLAAAAVVAVGFDMTPAGAQPKRAIRRPRPALLRGERPQCVLSAGAAHPHLCHQALLARCRCRSIAGRPQVHRLRVPAGARIPIVRAREQQPPDRPPAAEPAVGHGRISAELPAVLSGPLVYENARPWPGIFCDGGDFCLRVQRLQFLQNRLAHLRGRDRLGALGLDIRRAQAARQHRRDRRIDLVGQRAHIEGIAQRHSE